MLLLLVDFFKLCLVVGLVVAVGQLTWTRLLMPKIFWLIALFVQLSFLLMLHGIEFLAFVVLLLYVGAISVLFLFVVMILNPDAQAGQAVATTTLPAWAKAYTRVTPGLLALVLGVFRAELYSVERNNSVTGLWLELVPFWTALQSRLYFDDSLLLSDVSFFLEFLSEAEVATLAGRASAWGAIAVNGLAPTSDLWFIAESFYTEDFVRFWLVGLILLVAMVGAILLTLQKRRGLKRQKITTQRKRYHAFGR